jgi:hypothetical protein
VDKVWISGSVHIAVQKPNFIYGFKGRVFGGLLAYICMKVEKNGTWVRVTKLTYITPSRSVLRSKPNVYFELASDEKIWEREHINPS